MYELEIAYADCGSLARWVLNRYAVDARRAYPLQLNDGGETFEGRLGYLVVDRAGQRRFSQGEVELVATFAQPAPWRMTLPAYLAELFGHDECLVWPLRGRRDVLGALVVEVNPLLGRRLTIMNGMAHRVTMAMENARLAREVALQERLEREMEVGRDIQGSFRRRRTRRRRLGDQRRVARGAAGWRRLL